MHRQKRNSHLSNARGTPVFRNHDRLPDLIKGCFQDRIRPGVRMSCLSADVRHENRINPTEYKKMNTISTGTTMRNKNSHARSTAPRSPASRPAAFHA